MCDERFIIEPKVDEVQEFLEIANDFSNPLELVREAISNAFDAEANKIWIEFMVEESLGEKQLVIKIKDNGKGMDYTGLQSFFDLGNSLRRGNKKSIGEKGHGTKVYFNSDSIKVITVNGVDEYIATMENPFFELHNRRVPKVEVKKNTTKSTEYGTEIIIRGYNRNRREKFSHNILKDYIMWFTKFGSFEKVLDINDNCDKKLYLKGLPRNDFEEIDFGHFFPNETSSINKLFETSLTKAPSLYCKRIVKKGQLANFPEIEFEAVFSIEGNRVKYSYNDMIRRSGYSAPKGAYTVQDRYGLWLCKDFIPIQRMNNWIAKKGSEYTKFHAFVNCQDFKLTANRGSIENTPSEYIDDLRVEVERIYNEIINGDDWIDIEWLESEATAHNTVEKEKKEFEKRKKRINKTNISIYKGYPLVQPIRESGVYALTVKLMMIEPELFPFSILDYDTYSGVDVIAKGNDNLKINQSKLFYIEFKALLSNNFNHSFENIFAIVCWDIDIKNNDKITDIAKKSRTLKIIQPENEKDYTRYFLEDLRESHRIEVFVLKDYLKEKLAIEFRPRTEQDTI